MQVRIVNYIERAHEYECENEDGNLVRVDPFVGCACELSPEEAPRIVGRFFEIEDGLRSVYGALLPDIFREVDGE